jgi:hypothetical protein
LGQTIPTVRVTTTELGMKEVFDEYNIAIDTTECKPMRGSLAVSTERNTSIVIAGLDVVTDRASITTSARIRETY